MPALVDCHAEHGLMLFPAARHQLTAPDDGVMQEHRPNYHKNEQQVYAPHPAHGHCSEVCRAAIHVHFIESELLRNALMALPTRRVKVGVRDSGAGITRWQNIMHTVATGTVGDDYRAAFRCESVIAVEISRYTVSSDAKFLRKSYTFMASCACCASYILI